MWGAAVFTVRCINGLLPKGVCQLGIRAITERLLCLFVQRICLLCVHRGGSEVLLVHSVLFECSMMHVWPWLGLAWACRGPAVMQAASFLDLFEGPGVVAPACMMPCYAGVGAVGGPSGFALFPSSAGLD